MNAFGLAVAVCSLAIAATAAGVDSGKPPAGSGVIPTPRVEKLPGGRVVLAPRGKPVTCSAEGVSAEESMPVKEGCRLVERRLKVLGAAWRTVSAMPAAGGPAAVRIRKVAPEALSGLLGRAGAKVKLDPTRLEQAYVLGAEGDAVTVSACGGPGLYYGLVTLVQLLARDERGSVCVPAATLADYPEVGLRLAKTSASANPVEKVGAFSAWLPVMKMNLLGLQYHGGSSMKPEGNFARNIEAHCRRCRRGGILKTVVYFCPFRGRRAAKGADAGGGAYDFRKPEHRKAYVDFLLSVLEEGAHGVEIDYNDWPDRKSGVGIEDVINLACKGIAEKHPEAYVLYCPPAGGASSYRGKASPEMRRILSKVPAKVWPLWTGMRTLITKPLKAEQVEAWTRTAGRRPFLWVNRVSLGVASHFARRVPEAGGAYAFRGGFLPKELHRLVEGVHFNAGISKGYNRLTGEFAPGSLAYLATAADYVWNPHDWSPGESARRARRFVDVMRPVLRGAEAEKPPETGAAGAVKGAP